MKVMEDINCVATLQVHSLEVVSDHFDNRIINAEQEIHHISTYSSQIEPKN